MYQMLGVLLFPIGFFMTVVFLLCYFYYIIKITKRLEENHFDFWKDELGSFRLITNNSLSTGRKMMRFLKKREYEKLEDPLLREKIMRCLHYYKLTSMCFVIFAIGAILITCLPQA